MHELSASPWVLRFTHLVAPGETVLDVASGAGRHARWLAQHGARVLAVDRDAALLAAMDGVPGIETRCADLEAGGWPLGAARFDAVVVTNYLHRPLFAHLRAALAPGALLLYETFALGNERYGRPSNPAFLLEPGELLRTFGSDLTVIGFEQGEVRDGARTAVVQRIAAVERGRAWPAVLAP